MRQNIFIRLLCLLLCVSMLTPVAASASNGGQQSPNNPRNTPQKLLSNEMYYVNQFFNHDGSFSNTGEVLLHWLDMTPNGENVDQWQGGGYLTLEQEIDGRSGVKYSINKNINTITGIPAAVIKKFTGNSEAEEMFPNAGKSAIIYYNMLQQIYVEYKQEIVKQIAEAELNLDVLDKAFDEINEYGMDLLAASSVKASAIVFTNPTKRTRGTQYDVYDLFDIQYDEFKAPDGSILRENVLFGVRKKNGEEMYVPLKQLTENCRENSVGLVLNTTKVTEIKTAEPVYEIIDQEARKFAAVNEAMDSKPNSRTLNIAQVQDVAEGVKQADNYDNMDSDQKKVLDMSNEDVIESAKKHKTDKINRWEDIGYFLDAAGVGIDAYCYWKNYENMTTLQASYMDAMFDVTEEYRSMLDRWRNSLEVTEEFKDEQFQNILDSMNYNPPAGDDGYSGVESNSFNTVSTRIAIQDALDAMKTKMAITYLETVDTMRESIEAESYVLMADERNEVVIGGIQTVLEFSAGEVVTAVKAAKAAKAAAIAKAATDTAANTAGTTTAGVTTAGTTVAGSTSVWAGIGAAAVKLIPPIAWAAGLSFSNSVTGKRLEFADEATAITNLKHSLNHLLTEEKTGLLAQYAKNPTHETACAIIEALKTMVVAKYYGENLVREYYLADLYKDLKIDPGSSVHTVLWNELQLNRIGRLPNIAMDKNVVNFVNVVYEEDVKIQVDEETEKITQVMGVYARDPGVQLSYESKTLEPFDNYPAYKRLTMKDPQTYGSGVDFDTWVSGRTLNANNPNKRYQSHGAFLYTRNGMDLILTVDEISRYSMVQLNLESMYKKYTNPNEKMTDSERMNINRLQWAWDCQQWIESFEMYSDAVNYKTHKIKHGALPN